MSTILPPRTECGNSSEPCASGSSSLSTSTKALAPQIDAREQLYNVGLRGPIQQVQLCVEQITRLLGILFDIDPKLFRIGGLFSLVPADPREFYTTVLGPMLARHPVLTKVQAIVSGTGIHVILRIDPPIELKSAADQQRWAGNVEVVQAALPIDPDQPGITAVTRPIGSINGKNGALVELVAAGEPVTEQEVMSLYEEMIRSPFATVCKILTGDTKVSPCPICRQPDSTLSALNWVGKCYGSCGKVTLAQLYDAVLAPRVAEAR